MATYKIIGGDQKEYGPVTAEELRRWIVEGRLNGQSGVRIEGSNDWRPLATYPEFADALRVQAGQFPVSGAAVPAASVGVWSEQILARASEVQIGRCLGRSWELLSANFGLFFGATFLVWFIAIICYFLPLAGLVYWVIHGVLYGGLYLILLNRIRGQPAAVGDAFAGFSLAFAQLALAGAVSSLLSLIGFLFCFLPGIYLWVAWVFGIPLVADKRLEFWSAMELSRKVVTRVWFEMFGLVVLAFLPFILMYLFAEINISVAMYSAIQEMMESGRPDLGRMMQMFFQMAKTSIPLMLLVKFILLLNLPFALGALMYAYEDLFGTRTAPAA